MLAAASLLCLRGYSGISARGPSGAAAVGTQSHGVAALLQRSCPACVNVETPPHPRHVSGMHRVACAHSRCSTAQQLAFPHGHRAWRVRCSAPPCARRLHVVGVVALVVANGTQLPASAAAALRVLARPALLPVARWHPYCAPDSSSSVLHAILRFAPDKFGAPVGQDRRCGRHVCGHS